jgi:hypothetical protein
VEYPSRGQHGPHSIQVSLPMSDQDVERRSAMRTDEPVHAGDEWDESGEDEVPSVVLYVIAGLLIISFTMYLIVGGGHSHFH